MTDPILKRLLEQERAGGVLSAGDIDLDRLRRILSLNDNLDHARLYVALKEHVIATKNLKAVLGEMAEAHGVNLN